MDFVDAPVPAMTLRDRWAALARNRLVRSVGVLVGGTAFAHAITAATLPIVTRLYTPADFSVLAVFASLLSIVSVAACLRFDVAIPIPEHDAEAVNLLALALGCTAIEPNSFLRTNHICSAL
jgi:O-antigen/teichoic acid export membrane protein